VFKSDRSRYSTYYDDDTKTIVARLYGDDIEKFGYAFEQ